jgi:hypothetical protein
MPRRAIREFRTGDDLSRRKIRAVEEGSSDQAILLSFDSAFFDTGMGLC